MKDCLGTSTPITMFKKLLIVSLITLGGIKAKAQYIHYDPIGPAAPSQTPAETNIQTVTGYTVDNYTQQVQKIKLKLVQVQRTVIIVGVKELASQYWTDFTVNRPVAQKLNSYDALSDQFEYKVYVPVLGKVVYF